MGSTVQAWLGSEDGLCTHLLNGPLDRFEQWAREAATEWPNLPSAEVVALLGAVRAAGSPALDARDPDAARAVDDLIQSYYGDFASLRGGHSRRAIEAALPERYYRAALDTLVATQASASLVLSWRFVLDGRPPMRDAATLPFAPSRGSLRLGYWTLAECKTLRPALEQRVRTSPEGESKSAFAAAAEAATRAEGERVGLIFATG